MIADSKLASQVIIIGSVLFLIAAFLPYSKIFAVPEPEARLRILNELRTQWNIGQVLFGLGAIITVVGLGMLIMAYRQAVQINWAFLGVIVLLLGSLLWTWHCVERMISPEKFVNGELTPHLFLLYSILSQAGFIVLGIFILRTDMAAWTGWMLIGGTALISALMIIFRDMPPFVYYVLTITLAIKLFIDAGRAVAS